MPSVMLRIDWMGKFVNGKGERITRTLGFNATDESKGLEIIATYIQVQNEKGWTLVKNRVKTSQVSS